MNKSQHPGPEECRQIIEEQQPSGLTVAGYCRQRASTQGSFYTWKRRLRTAAMPCHLPKPTFVEVTPPRTQTGGTIEICLHGERRLLVRRGFDHDLLIDLVRTLEATP
jgi:hypothetical protein